MMTDTANPERECLGPPRCQPDQRRHDWWCPLVADQRPTVTAEPRRRGRPPGTGRTNPRSKGYNRGRKRNSRGF